MKPAARRAAAAGVAAAALASAAALAVTAPLPPAFPAVRAAHRPSDALLLDRRGEPLHSLRVDATVRRLAWTPLSAVSPALRAAVVASEDRRFREHGGVDFRALVAAARDAVLRGRPRGASTLSMQLAALLERDRGGAFRGLGGKWRQMRAARAIERRWSKDEILEAYLNRVPFRGEVEGVTAAARLWFGKVPHGLDAAESAVLAALVPAPNAAAAAVERRARAVAALAGRSPPAEAVARAVRAVSGSGRGRRAVAALAPHLAERLRVRLGEEGSVETTLDARVQRIAADAVRGQVLAVREHGVSDGAALVVDNASGEVLAWVGGTGELATAAAVDAARARRQAGSSLKPFLYGAAFERRVLTPASLLEDAPLEVPVATGLYRPRNYDERFRGLVSVRAALGASLNVPAVRAVALVGVEELAARLRALGFAGLSRQADFYGPALALGSLDVTLAELAGAYRALATGGEWSPLRVARGEPVEAPRRVFSPATAFLVSSILSDRESRSTTFGLESPLATPFWSAVKTGTSKDMRDNWCVGFTRRHTVAVWVGNLTGEPMHDVTGITGAAPAWLEIVSALEEAGGAPPPPDGVVRRRVAFPGGSEPERDDWFLAGTEPAAGGERLARVPRILAPTSGTVFAPDPDVPPGRERLRFEADAAEGLRWRLDGADAGPAEGVLLWPPRPGAHRLELVDAGGAARDAVAFRVREGGLAQAAAR